MPPWVRFCVDWERFIISFLLSSHSIFKLSPSLDELGDAGRARITCLSDESVSEHKCEHA